YRNLWLVFLLCGLWHGANWTFVVWGAHHGFFLVAERAGLAVLLRNSPTLAARAYALLAVMSGWVWFRAAAFPPALTMFGSLIGLNGWGALPFETHIVLFPATLAALAIGVALSIADWRMIWTGAVCIHRFALPLADTVRTAMFLVFS